jgi:hypothetical protein
MSAYRITNELYMYVFTVSLLLSPSPPPITWLIKIEILMLH